MKVYQVLSFSVLNKYSEKNVTLENKNNLCSNVIIQNWFLVLILKDIC